MKVFSQNPATDEIVQEYNTHRESEIDDAIAELQDSFLQWRTESVSHRISALLSIAMFLRSQRETMAQLAQLEMGKSIEEGLAEVDKCAACAEYYANNGEKLLADQLVKTEASKSYVTFQPIGVVFAIMPWNFPFWQALRCALPALLMGNVVLLKHASNVSGCALFLEKLIQEASPDLRLFRTILASGATAESVIARPGIAAVSFTGSTLVGRKIASACGTFLKKVVLELGGSDPYIVLADADLEPAAKICAKSRLLNAGQSCIAAKRFIVAEKICGQFLELFRSEMERLPLAPMAKKDLRLELQQQVEKSVSQGASLVCGGKIPSGAGNFYPATILKLANPKNLAFEEEFFGPAAAICAVTNEEQAIQLANDSNFGLGAAVFSRDIERAEKIARNLITAGSVFVNDFVKSDPRLPFGGTKESGFGRELSHFGLYEFSNIKTVVVK